mgnify:CR=1 FL=1
MTVPSRRMAAQQTEGEPQPPLSVSPPTIGCRRNRRLRGDAVEQQEDLKMILGTIIKVGVGD